MKNKNIVYLTVLFVSLIAAFFVYYDQLTSNLAFKESKIFEFDSSKVDLIKIESSTNSIELSRTNGTWTVNKTYRLDPLKFKALFEAHKRLTIKSPASPGLVSILQGQKQNSGTIITIKENNGKKRSFIIVFDTLQQTGSYVTLPKNNEFYQVFLPGYRRDNLTTLYPVDVSFWRDKTLIALKPEEISTISIDYPARPAASFTLINVKDSVKINNMKLDISQEMIDYQNVHQFLGYFLKIQFDSMIEDDQNKEVTNIGDSQPEAIVTVSTSEGNNIELVVINKFLAEDSSKLDPNFFYVKRSDYEGVMLVDFVEIAPVLKTVGYLLKK